MALANKVIYQNGAIREFEKPEVCEAIKVANANRWTVALSPTEWDQREARLKDEYGKNHVKRGEPIPGSPALEESASQFNDALLDEQAKKIDEQNHEITRLLSLVEKKENSISRLYYEKSVLEKENEDLKKGELPARYFDKALVDEQSEKIKELEHEKLDILEMASSCKQAIEELIKEKSNLEDQITVLNACKKHNDKIDRKQIKCLGKEIARLNGIIHDKNAILADVAEELRLTKIREKNLAELGLKYVGENEKLKEQLADKVVDKIDVQALKSAESALAWKEKVIAGKDMALAYYKKKIAEKDEVIADLTHELKAKHKKYVWYKGAYDAAQQILNTIADYAAKHPDKKFSDQMVGIDNAEEGGDQSATIVQCGNGITISKEEAEIIERCTKNSTELHYSKKDGFTYTNVFGEEMPIRCLRGMFYAFTDEEIENMKK